MRAVLVLAYLIFSLAMSAQVKLNNPSFEGVPREATIPAGWEPCQEGTTPDILPGPWDVTTLPAQGQSFMGLITRRDGSWESVGQNLSDPLAINNCYTFSLRLAHSETYAGYNLPLRLRIWGGTDSCKKGQLIGETGPIDHPEWKTYNFRFFTETTVNYLILEAYNVPGVYIFYNGNILIDDCSVIEPCKRAGL